jgi:hypothetical protein
VWGGGGGKGGETKPPPPPRRWQGGAARRRAIRQQQDAAGARLIRACAPCTAAAEHRMHPTPRGGPNLGAMYVGWCVPPRVPLPTAAPVMLPLGGIIDGCERSA